MLRGVVIVLAVLWAAPGAAVGVDWPSFAMTHDGSEVRGDLRAEGAGGVADLAAGRVETRTVAGGTSISLFVDLFTVDRAATIRFRQTTTGSMRSTGGVLSPLVGGLAQVYDVTGMSFDASVPPSIWDPLPYGIDFRASQVAGTFFVGQMSDEDGGFCDTGDYPCVAVAVPPSAERMPVSARLAGSFEARPGSVYALLVRGVASGDDSSAETGFAFTDLGGATLTTKSGHVPGQGAAPAPVPLPASAFLILAGCGAIGAIGRRRMARAA